MSEQKESSVLFSLKELMNLEEDRIKTEETSKAEAARMAEQQRLRGIEFLRRTDSRGPEGIDPAEATRAAPPGVVVEGRIREPRGVFRKLRRQRPGPDAPPRHGHLDLLWRPDGAGGAVIE